MNKINDPCAGSMSTKMLVALAAILVLVAVLFLFGLYPRGQESAPPDYGGQEPPTQAARPPGLPPADGGQEPVPAAAPPVGGAGSAAAPASEEPASAAAPPLGGLFHGGRRPPTTAGPADGALPALLASADRELSRLSWQQMAFSVPEKMELGSTAFVELAVGGGKSVDDLVGLLDAAGKREGMEVQVSDDMEAHLTGDGFQITPTTPETQLVSSIQVTRWKWQIKALEVGTDNLSLSLNALLTVNGQSGKKSVQTFAREISVKVTSVTGVWAFIDQYRIYIGGFITVVLVPLVVYFFKNRKSRGTLDA